LGGGLLIGMVMKIFHVFREKHEYFNETKHVVLNQEIDKWHF